MVMVGEQPGDREDIEGEPFVGPAGRLLDGALEQAKIDRGEVYLTNAVKHFKWEPRGRSRLHKKPSAREIAACKPWLEAEFEAVSPEVVVCLGATAAQAILGRGFLVTRDRGVLLEGPSGISTIATVHPASILRARDPATRTEEHERFVTDLKVVRQVLAA